MEVQGCGFSVVYTTFPSVNRDLATMMAKLNAFILKMFCYHLYDSSCVNEHRAKVTVNIQSGTDSDSEDIWLRVN